MTRLEELRDFARTWLHRDLTPSDGVEVPDSCVMPQALREVYQTFGAVPQLTRPHNELLAPSALVSEGGYSIFYDENQQVVRWAFRDSDRLLEDPVVYQGVTQAEGYDWYSEDMTISAWIRVMNLWQLVNGGYKFGAYAAGIEDATRAVEALYPRVGGHVDGSTVFYGIPRQLIALSGSAGIPSVWAAGATREDLFALSNTLGFDWDSSSDDD